MRAAGGSLTLPGETICPYCGVGCRLQFEGSPAEGLGLRAASDSPASLARMCAKGALLCEAILTSDRLQNPLVRAGRHAPWRQTTWDAALETVVSRLKAIVAAHGPDAVAFYGSGQLDTETAYLACKL